jgi:hypothetical protein
VSLAPTGKRRLVTAHARSRLYPAWASGAGCAAIKRGGMLTVGPLIEPQFRPFLLLHGYLLNSWFGARAWRFRGKSAIDSEMKGLQDYKPREYRLCWHAG